MISILLATTAGLLAATAQDSGQTNAPAPTAAAAAPAPAQATPAFQLNESTWTFTGPDGTNVRESVDADGNYIAETAGGEHLDHGTAVLKDGKACFTSAMNKSGEICWTTQAIAIGQSADTVSDAGQKLTVTRVAYTPLSMPK